MKFTKTVLPNGLRIITVPMADNPSVRVSSRRSFLNYFLGIGTGGWRAFMEYGNGIVGDMCIHMLDMVRWMLGLGWPKSVGSAGQPYHRQCRRAVGG